MLQDNKDMPKVQTIYRSRKYYSGIESQEDNLKDFIEFIQAR